MFATCVVQTELGHVFLTRAVVDPSTWGTPALDVPASPFYDSSVSSPSPPPPPPFPFAPHLPSTPTPVLALACLANTVPAHAQCYTWNEYWWAWLIVDIPADLLIVCYFLTTVPDVCSLLSTTLLL
jgi:hypothetical protein